MKRLKNCWKEERDERKNMYKEDFFKGLFAPFFYQLEYSQFSPQIFQCVLDARKLVSLIFGPEEKKSSPCNKKCALFVKAKKRAFFQSLRAVFRVCRIGRKSYCAKK